LAVMMRFSADVSCISQSTQTFLTFQQNRHPDSL
jgi:hypothetical protein